MSENITPEDYWISRGSDLIGLDVLRDGSSARQATTYQTIAEECQNHSFILDIGCNCGALNMFIEAEAMKRGNPDIEYLGIDSNPNAVKFCVDHGINAKVGNLHKILKIIWEIGRYFECVVIKDVLEHLENLEPIREAFRVSNKTVIASFFIPPEADFKSIIKMEAGYYHNQYDEVDLLRVAKECSFSLEKRIDTWEKDNNMNRTYVFVRG